MSQENLEIGRRYVEAVNARKVPEELLAPDFRIENAKTAVTDQIYFGPAGFRKWMDDFFGVLGEGARYEAGDVIASGDDYLVGPFNIVGVGSTSAAPVELRHWGVLWFRDGKITGAIGYPTRREALEAVGLSE